MKYKRVVITRHGGPEVLQVVEDELPEPQVGQVRVKILAASFHSIGGGSWQLLRRRSRCCWWSSFGIRT